MRKLCAPTRLLSLLGLILTLVVAPLAAQSPTKVPANAHVVGNAWYCNAGFKQVGETCQALQVPANAHVVGNAWYCNAGFKQVGNTCEALRVPANAHVVGNAWYCNAGFKQVGNTCEALRVPANAHVVGNAWYCNAGFKQVGETCQALQVPANAHVVGNAWYCDDGFKQLGQACAAMTPTELREQQEQKQALARQAAVDSSRAWMSRIDRDSNDVLMLESGAVVEVTSGYVGYVGYRKQAVLFKDGASWKIWIEAKRTFPCDVLKRPSSGAVSVQRFAIDEVSSSGDIIVTTGGVVFRASSTSGWTSGASVLLLDGTLMVNLDSGDMSSVSRLR